ncbi:MAG TPA: ATP synthase subunit I [Bryobacteraceae bacterium]|jgi:hypothetical protein|nr:ATP synthase subunit I [Bryobacteraceae bacterium]
MAVDFDKGIARIPPLIAVLGLIGSGAAWRVGGVAYGSAFLVGAAAAYFNFRLLERFVDRLGKAVAAEPARPRKAAGAVLFLQFALFVLVAFVILRLSGFNVVAALCGFLVCPAAVMLEILYELFTYGHS